MSVLDDHIKILVDMMGQDKNIVGTFYYDETNIFHKLRVTKTGSNNDLVNQSFFGLGGLYLGKNQFLNIDELLSLLKPQKSMKEFKYLFFSRKNSNVIEALKSNRFLILMEWLDKNKVHIHFTLMDYLYYGISDIIDSLPDAVNTAYFNRELKSTLYNLVRANLDLFLDLFYEFNYPNIARERREEFINIFYEIYLNLFFCMIMNRLNYLVNMRHCTLIVQ